MLRAVSVPCLLPHGALQGNRRARVRSRVERRDRGRRHAGDPLQVWVHCRSVRLTRYPDRRTLATGRAPAPFSCPCRRRRAPAARTAFWVILFPHSSALRPASATAVDSTVTIVDAALAAYTA